MRWLALFVCVCLALVSFSHFNAELGLFSGLGLERTRTFYLLLPVAAVLSFIILTVGFGGWNSSQLRNPRNALLVGIRVLLVAVIWVLVWVAPGGYRRMTVTSVPVHAETMEKINWQRFQSALNFKVVRITDSDGQRIYFAKADGRQEQLESVLSKLETTPATSRRNGP